jgi:hypothetical protein
MLPSRLVVFLANARAPFFRHAPLPSKSVPKPAAAASEAKAAEETAQNAV